jgi:hypothetical protein
MVVRAAAMCSKILEVKKKDAVAPLYPGLTAEAFRAREAAFERCARWEAEHPKHWDPAAAIAAVTALYDLLPEESRRRAPDPSGIMAFHALLSRTLPTVR